MEPKKLTASEVNNLWNSYLANTMAEYVTRYLVAKTQDPNIHQVLEYAEEIAMEEVKQSQIFLEEVGYPLPKGFDEGDVDIHGQPLYNDQLALIIKYTLAQDATVVYSASLATCTRSDIRKFYQTCLHHSAELLHRLADVMVKKGLHHPEIYVPKPDKIEMVEKQNFLAGWFTDRRLLNVAEINQLVFNFRGAELHKEFLKSFAQVSPTKELREHFGRGAEILDKHLDIFQSLLSESDLSKLPTWESEIIDIKTSPFSERLMLYKMSLMTAARTARYGTALSMVLRRDLGMHFMRLMTETLKYGEDCANLMIKYGFMDQLPMAKEKPTDSSQK